jgi:hypothetical protein
MRPEYEQERQEIERELEKIFSPEDRKKLLEAFSEAIAARPQLAEMIPFAAAMWMGEHNVTLDEFITEHTPLVKAAVRRDKGLTPD